MNITVIGGGSWATALIKILSEKSVKIKWWLRDAADIEHIKKHHHNPQYLSSVELHPSKVKPYANLKDALKNTDLVILAVPAAFVMDALSTIDEDNLKNKVLISAVKGMIPDKNLLVTDWLVDRFKVSKNKIGVIAGPCHAEEVALEKQSYLTIASEDQNLAVEFAQLLKCRFVNTSFITDLDGVEYAAVMKNIIAKLQIIFAHRLCMKHVIKRDNFFNFCLWNR